MPWPTYAGPPEEELRRLYVEERMTCRQLAERYDVSHMSIKRWLRRFDIPRRPASSGLLYRGVTPPTAKELERMVHHEHLSYVQIAAKFDVDMTAVPYWLKKHGIRRPTIWETRRKGKAVVLPSASELQRRYADGEPLGRLADDYGTSRQMLRKVCEDAGIPLRPDGFQGGRRWECLDGHLARSSYERRVDDWLYENGFAEPEPRLPFDRRYRADFLVNGVYIEIWGVVGSASYEERRRRKVRLYHKHGLQLVELPHWIFVKAKCHQWPMRLRRALST